MVAAASFLTQCRDRGMPYHVQAYIDKTQASNKVIDSVEQLISARQLAMVSVASNIYDPRVAIEMSAAAMSSDAQKAVPVTLALGNFKAAIQNSERFFHDPKTKDALSKLDEQAVLGVKCFTDLASAGHELDAPTLQYFREMVSSSCKDANVPSSLNDLKAAEEAAMDAMDAERSSGHEKVPEPS